MTDLLILHNGLLAFYRSYGERFLEDFDVTAGFFQAILEFSKLEVGESLETISMSDSLFHFYARNGFAFVLKEERNIAKGVDEVARILDELADCFFEEFPYASHWNGVISYFANFTVSCDRILQERPTRKGFPVLFRIALKPFFITPQTQVVPISPDHEESLYELQHYLKKYAEQAGRKRLAHLIRKPFLLYLPRTQRIAYVFAFHLDLRRYAITHLLCYVAEERDWFAFYQLISLFFKRAQFLVPDIAGYLKLLESNPIEDEIRQDRPRIQQIVNDWADLNQYISAMAALLSEEFFRAGFASEDLSEEQTRAGFIDLLDRVGQDFDKVLSAALGQRQVLFVGTDRQLVEQLLSALLKYLPHPSVCLWDEEPCDAQFVGTRPDLVKFYDESSVVVDVENNQVNGGEKNQFCANLLSETSQFAKDMSVSESRMFFQGKISAIFTLLKAFLEVLTFDEEEQQQRFQEMLQKYPEDSIELMTQIGRNLNGLLAKSLRQARTGAPKKSSRKPKPKSKAKSKPKPGSKPKSKPKPKPKPTPKDESSGQPDEKPGFILFSD